MTEELTDTVEVTEKNCECCKKPCFYIGGDCFICRHCGRKQ